MATDSKVPPSSDLALDIATVVARDAYRDADRVGLFLAHLGMKGTPEKPLALPPSFLLRLGFALRLLDWEQKGYYFHREVGVPEAQLAIREAFLRLNDVDADPTKSSSAILNLSLERFAWSGPPELGADIALHGVQDDTLLEALADLLWTHRPCERSGRSDP
jgi:hypothetical protein